jgi:pimeloyl-ACP methyl ester carboxylesterase
MAPPSKKMGAASRVASEIVAPTPSSVNGSSEGTLKGTTSYCQYLGSLVTKLDRLARIPKLIIESTKYAIFGSDNQYKKREDLKSDKRPRSLKPLFYCLAAGIVAAMATLDQSTLFKLSNSLLKSKTPWHTGAAWKQFLDMYDVGVEARLSHCERRQISTRYGSTMVHICGNATDDTAIMFPGLRASSNMWDFVTNHKELLRRRRLVLVDHICDAGRSVPVACPDTANDHAAWIEDIYAGLGVKSADLVGYSYGCFTTALVAIAAPSMVKKVIQIGPTGLYGAIPTRVVIRMLLAAIASPFPSLELNAAWILGSMAHGEDHELAQGLLAQYEAASVVPYNSTLAMFYKLSDAELAKLAMTKVTAVIPEYEVIMDVQEVTSRLANAKIRVEIMKGAGHRVRIEDPDSLLDVIARLLLAKD